MSEHFNILEQLNEKTLANGSDAASIKTVTDNIHLTNGNKDLLRVVELVNKCEVKEWASIETDDFFTFYVNQNATKLFMQRKNT